MLSSSGSVSAIAGHEAGVGLGRATVTNFTALLYHEVIGTPTQSTR